MLALWFWTYASSVLAHAVFLDLPGSALWGGVVHGRGRASRWRSCRTAPMIWLVAAPVDRADRAHGRQRRACCAARRAARPPRERVAVLLPLRDEADRVTPCLESLLAQRGVPGLTSWCSTTARPTAPPRWCGRSPATRSGCSPAPRCRPAGWASRTPAAQLAAAAGDADVLVFVDADVVLPPDAVAGGGRPAAGHRGARCCRRTRGSPGPGRLVQPLLQWSWLTFLPLRAMERSPRAVAGRRGRAVAGRGPGRLRPGGRARRGPRRRAGGHRAGPRGETVRRPDRPGRRLPAGDLPDVRRRGRRWSTATRKSLWASFGSRPARPPSWSCSFCCTWSRRSSCCVAGGCAAGGPGRVPARGGRPGGLRARDRRPGLAGRAGPPAVGVAVRPGWSCGRSGCAGSGRADAGGGAAVSRVVVIGAGVGGLRGRDPAGRGRARGGGARARRAWPAANSAGTSGTASASTPARACSRCRRCSPTWA